MRREVRERVETLVADLRAGRVTPETERVADALERVLLGRLESTRLDAELGLRPTRGRPKGAMTFGKLKIETAGDLRGLTANELLGKIDPVGRFIREAIRADRTRRGARARALRAAEQRFHLDPRAIERRWKNAKEFFDLIETMEAFRKRLAPLVEKARGLPDDAVLVTAKK